jgi:hypothetical protein
MEIKKLKRGIFTSPQSGSIEFERYVIENEEDLNKFLKEFPHRMTMVGKRLKESLEEGYIILATDAHPLTGMFTYCFETKDKNNMHPSSFHRVRLIN